MPFGKDRRKAQIEPQGSMNAARKSKTNYQSKQACKGKQAEEKASNRPWNRQV
jgi:hypothetical protein